MYFFLIFLTLFKVRLKKEQGSMSCKIQYFFILMDFKMV